MLSPRRTDIVVITLFTGMKLTAFVAPTAAVAVAAAVAQRRNDKASATRRSREHPFTRGARAVPGNLLRDGAARFRFHASVRP